MSASEIEFRPLTPDRWADLVSLFGARGACGGCWCMAWRLPRRVFDDGKGAENRRTFQRIVKSGRPPGILAYRGGRAVGWCAVAPRASYDALGRSRVLAPVDDALTWSVSCFFVVKEERRRGLSKGLLEAAVELARSGGARIVEGYPVDSVLPDAFVWTGLPSAFRRAGFREVARRSPTRPIMRRRLPSRRTSPETPKGSPRTRPGTSG